MYIGIKKWKKDECLLFIAFFLFLDLHLTIAAYPIITWDSARYLSGAVFLKPNCLSLTLVPYLLKPLVALSGAWGFAIFQMAILSYTLVSAVQFFHTNFIVGLLSMIISAAAYFAISVMMDIYTAIGLLALFLVLSGHKDLLLYIILSICYVAHYENILLFSVCAIIYWLIFNRREVHHTARPVIIAFAVPIIAVLLTNYFLGIGSLFFPKTLYTMPAVRIMADSREIAESYMKEYPDSYFSKCKKFYEYAVNKDDPFHILLWKEKESFGCRIDSVEFNNEAKKFTFYALKNYKYILFKNALKNTYRFLAMPGYCTIGGYNKYPMDGCIKKIMPWQFEDAKRSLQYKGKSLFMNFGLFYILCYYICFPIILFFVFGSFVNRKIKNSTLYPFAVFVVILVSVNACIMSNFVGPYSRYQLRLALLPALAAILIITNFKIGTKRYV